MLSSDTAEIEYSVLGSGDPVTVFAHGVGASIEETQLLCAGVGGTCVFFQFRGHGDSSATDDRYDYPALAGDLRAVADHVGATRALGVSMGAAALLHLLVDAPDRFERVVFFLPAVLDVPRADDGLDTLGLKADLVDDGDEAGLADQLREEMPDGVQDSSRLDDYVRDQAAALVGTEVSELLRRVPFLTPVKDLSAVRCIEVPVLVVGQEGDDIHPAAVARALAGAMPQARLALFSEGSAVWADTERLHALLGGFLHG